MHVIKELFFKLEFLSILRNMCFMRGIKELFFRLEILIILRKNRHVNALYESQRGFVVYE